MNRNTLFAVAATFAPALALGAGSNAFNPDIALVLSGTYGALQHDPANYAIPGFALGGESSPGDRGFSLGESELAIYGNVDPDWYGMLTFSMAGDNTTSVENAFVQTTSLGNGLTVKAGRFFSGIGYLNEQHSHTWDFVDQPLAYRAFLGTQYKDDGVQVRWLAPTDLYTEVGGEWLNGSEFPAGGGANSGRGTYSAFLHLGDDVGISNSWRAGVSYLNAKSLDRSTDSAAGSDLFNGKTRLVMADFVWKWAPQGNGFDRNLRLQAEYLRSTSDGRFTPAGGSEAPYSATASGWYVQGAYQFVHGWRVGLRHDRLDPASAGAAFANTVLDSQGHTPTRDSIMLDYTNSEFSRIRLQYNRDHSGPVADNQWFVQYVMSLGAHPAHQF